MITCKTLCNECPFSCNSSKGWLAHYTVMDFKDFMNNEILFPCHKLVTVDMSLIEASELIQQGKLRLCRGYVESMIKSCKLPKNLEFQKVINQIKVEELSYKSMAIWDFTTHHNE